MLVIDRDAWKLYELFDAHPLDGGKRWHAGSGAVFDQPFGAPASNNSPAATNWTQERNNEFLGQFTSVLSNRALNEVSSG